MTLFIFDLSTAWRVLTRIRLSHLRSTHHVFDTLERFDKAARIAIRSGAGLISRRNPFRENEFRFEQLPLLPKHGASSRRFASAELFSIYIIYDNLPSVLTENFCKSY